MEMLLSFIAGLVLAGIAAIFVLRTEKKAAVAALEADLKNAKDNLERAKSDAEKHTQELLDAKDKAHKEAIEALDNFADAVEGGDFGDIRAAIEALIYYIDLNDEEVKIHWKFA